MIGKLLKAVPLLGALALFAVVVVTVQEQAQSFNQRPLQRPESTVQRITVSVIPVARSGHVARVTGYGEATPHYELSLATQVSGRIDNLSEAFEAGNRVAAGEVLVTLEDSSYREALASAQNTLASNQVALLEEERQGEQARLEWQSSGLDGEPGSPLVLRTPQLASAQAAVAQARASVEAASDNLQQTRIAAPFDALVTARNVAPGGYAQAGAELATLVSTDRLEVSISLSAADWAQLPDASLLAAGQWPATLTNVENGEQWTGYVLRARQHLDSSSRQRSLVIAVDQPFDRSPALLPGTFVEASVTGRDIDGLWKLPATALGQDGRVWYVADDDTLASFEAEPLFADDGAIFLQPPHALSDGIARVVRQPLSSYVDGMAVQAVEEQPDA